MTKVYVFGPIHLFGRAYLPMYKKLVPLCRNYFDNVIATYPDFWSFKGTPKEFYKITVKKITDCDLFIAEVTSPSLGAGMELQMAVENKIPVIALAKEGVKISSMVLGLPTLQLVIRYKNEKDLLKKLDKVLNKW